MMEEKQRWNPLRGVMDAYKSHAAKFKEGGEYGQQTGDQQAERAYQDASGAANEGGVGQENPAMNEISRSASTGRARQMSQDFDASDPESVMRMQQQLNRGGYTDRYGNALEEDGKMGELTTGAMRKMQGDRNPEAAYEARGELGVSGDLQNKESADLNLRGEAPVTEPDKKEMSFMDKIFGSRGSGENRFGTPQGGRFYQYMKNSTGPE
jgi:hypothetical protein